MQELIASVDHITFDLELAVEQQLGAQPLPFPGMDSACGLSPPRGARAEAVGPRRVGWAGLGCLAGLQGSELLPQVLPIEPLKFHFPREVSVITQVFFFST